MDASMGMHEVHVDCCWCLCERLARFFFYTTTFNPLHRGQLSKTTSNRRWLSIASRHLRDSFCLPRDSWLEEEREVIMQCLRC